MRRDPDSWAFMVWVVAALIAASVVIYGTVGEFDLAVPQLLWALLALVPVIWLRFRRERRTGAQVRMSALNSRVQRRIDPLAILRPVAFGASLAGAVLLVLALARPQSEDSKESVKQEGIDIVVAMDVSVSMLARDLKPDRLEAAKKVAAEFIDGRPNDRIGLVVYEGEAYTQCPLTTDHRVLKELFAAARSGLIEGGTAVGSGLATAVNRLRESTSKSKVVILLTDGVSNRGTLQPLDAAMIAERMGVRVYTIGLGTRGKAYGPAARLANGQFVFDYVDVDLDEPTLIKVATTTGGKYFRATDERKLREIYGEIDRLEKTRIEVEQFTLRTDEYHSIALWGSLLVLGAFLLERTLLRGMV